MSAGYDPSGSDPALPMKTACSFHTAEVHEWPDASGFLTEVRRRVRVLDLLLISAVPVALLALHTLPIATRRALAFEYTRPTLLTAYTSNFVHLDWPHLAGNLVAYLLIVPTAYLLSVLSNRRRHFRLAFFVVIGACPFVVSLAQLPFRTEGISLGFSGLAMSFYGYASLVFVGYLATRLATAVHLDHAPLVFFAQIAAIAAITIPPSESTGPVLSPEVGQAGYTEITAFTVLAAAFFLVVGFTGGRVGRATVNLLAHFVARLPLCGPGHRLPATRFAVHAAAATGADRPAVPIAPAGNRQSHSSGLVS